MSFRRRRSEGGRGGPFIAALLVLSLVLIAALTRLAYDAARSHRRTAEGVLRDYASLAGHEYVRRAINEVGYYGCYPIVTALRNAPAPEGSPPSPSDLAKQSDEALARAATLASTIFRLDTATGDLTASGAPLDEETRAWLARSLPELIAAPPGPMEPFRIARADLSGRRRIFVVAMPGEKRVPGAPISGFEMDAGAIASGLERALGRGPLLPVSLGDGHLTNALLEVSVLDDSGGLLFHAGDPAGKEIWSEVPFGTTYGGLFAKHTARVGLDPAAAPMLVIGGLPRSRVPLLLALLALSAGLVAAAILLLRRERALAEMRSEFISRVSHELRTPLTQIRMFAETLLLDRVRSEGERRRSLEIIDREARRLGNLVENILHLSRGERGAVHLAPHSGDVAPIAAEITAAFRPLAVARGSDVVTRFEPGAVASIDDDALRQILINLLDNALKYGPPGQTITVGAAPRGGAVHIWVEDQGPGVPESERSKIWGRFQRMERDRAAAIAGTGIGLTVVRDLAALQGGRAWVESGSSGGARFLVELPSAPPPEGSQAAAATEPAAAPGAAHHAPEVPR